MDTTASNSDFTQESAWVAQTLETMESLQAPVWVYDIDNCRIIWCNTSCLDVWQAESKQELLSRELGADMSVSVENRLKQYKADFVDDASAEFREIWTLYPNGEPTSLDVVFSAFQLDTGRMCMFCEVTNSTHNEADALRSAEALLHTSVSISLYAATGEPLYRNPAARSTVTTSDRKFDQHYGNADLVNQLQNPSSDELNVVSSVHTIDGEKWHDITARRCMDAVSGEAAWLISEVDVSRLKAAEERAQFLAEHDTLTQLPNRNYVSIYFQARIEKLLSVNRAGALLFIDLDNFKDVNDTLGHDAGDQLLVEVAHRLKNTSVGADSVARLGGDEFLLLVEFTDNQTDTAGTTQEIIELLSEPVFIQERKIQVTTSIGVALFPDDGRSILDLMQRADLAMYRAKELGKNNVAYFTTALSEVIKTRINLEAELKSAIENNEFVAYFQPRVDVATGAIVGAEALVRWMHPSKGLVSPSKFIPACEASGSIASVGKIIFTQSVIAQRSFARNGHDIRLSVNLSPIQFSEESLVQDLIDIVEQNNGDPKKLELEITESVLLGNDHETISKLHQLVEYGFQISIDDFGTGYSSLAYLHKYPISCLKIDRSFVHAIDTTTPIVELIISMAKLFNMYVVAEGVEDTAQLDILRTYQCHEYQGFLFEKPIEFDKFSHLLSNHSKNVA